MTQWCGSFTKLLIRKGQPLRMLIQAVLQHFSPMKLVMKSFPLNTDCFGLFSFSQQGYLHLAWGRGQWLKKKVSVVANAQLKPEGKWSDGNTGVCFKGRGAG